MHLINRDESRHIAIDFHMTEHYCSDEYLAEIAHAPAPVGRARWLRMTRSLATMMWHAKPFLQQVFLDADGPHRSDAAAASRRRSSGSSSCCASRPSRARRSRR